MQQLTLSTFQSSISNGIVVVDFFATRCGPCKMIAPYLERLAEQTAGKVSFYKVDVDAEPALAQSQNITAMPTMKVFQDGNLVKEIVGADLQTLVETLKELIM